MQFDIDRLHLRPVKESDLDELFRIYGDPATNTFNPAGPYPDIYHAKNVLTRWIEHWDRHGFGDWAISEKRDPAKIIGFGGINIRQYGDVAVNNLGYRFETAAWGKGYATEFSRYAVKYGFTELSLTEITAIVRAHHYASQRVLKKSGLKFIKEIHDVEHAPPSLFFSLGREEWLGADA